MSNKNPNRPEPSKLYNYILHTREAVEIRLSNLLKHPSPLQKFSEESAFQWLKTQIEQQTGLDQRGFIIEEKDGSKWVRVWMKIRLCLDYGLDGFCRNQEKCKFWHVCKEFLEGNCVDASKCSRSHHFLDRHNEKIALKMGIAQLSPSNIFKVVVANLPVLCQKYIESECLNSDSSCHKVHLCPRYVKNVGRKTTKCKLSHNVQSPFNRQVLKTYSLTCDTCGLYHILRPKQTQNKEASETTPLQYSEKTKSKSTNDLNKVASTECLDSLLVKDYVVAKSENTVKRPKAQIVNNNINEVTTEVEQTKAFDSHLNFACSSTEDEDLSQPPTNERNTKACHEGAGKTELSLETVRLNLPIPQPASITLPTVESVRKDFNPPNPEAQIRPTDNLSQHFTKLVSCAFELFIVSVLSCTIILLYSLIFLKAFLVVVYSVACLVTRKVVRFIKPKGTRVIDR